MKNNKGIIVLLIALAVGGLGVYLYLSNSDFSKYCILAFTLAGVLLITAVSMIFKNSSPLRVYESKVNDILNTYDSVLVKSNSVPNIDDRNIVMVLSFDDLIDAQMEIRKPICYMKQTESCSFALLDDKEAYIYIEKLNDDITSPMEIAIKESKIKNKNKEEMDSEMLRDIEKTTVVKLSNQRSYKVSPIRKKKNESKEENKEEQEVKEEKSTNSNSNKDKELEEKIDDILNELDAKDKKKKNKAESKPVPEEIEELL